MLSRERSPMPRRGFLVGLAALPVASCVPTPAPAVPVDLDAELLALGHELEAAWALERDVSASLSGDNSPEADATVGVCCDRTSQVVSRIEGLTAATLVGLKVKLRALEWALTNDAVSVAALFGSENNTTDHRLVVAILNDLRTISKS